MQFTKYIQHVVLTYGELNSPCRHQICYMTHFPLGY